MSANNVRRHKTGRTRVVEPGPPRTEKVLGLIHLRERLAIAAAEYEAHDLDGAAEVFQQQLDISSPPSACTHPTCTRRAGQSGSSGTPSSRTPLTRRTPSADTVS